MTGEKLIELVESALELQTGLILAGICFAWLGCLFGAAHFKWQIPFVDMKNNAAAGIILASGYIALHGGAEFYLMTAGKMGDFFRTVWKSPGVGNLLFVLGFVPPILFLNTLISWPGYLRVLRERGIRPRWYGISVAEATAFIHKAHCLHCNYNLSGNESGVCPECGKRTS